MDAADFNNRNGEARRWRAGVSLMTIHQRETISSLHRSCIVQAAAQFSVGLFGMSTYGSAFSPVDFLVSSLSSALSITTLQITRCYKRTRSASSSSCACDPSYSALVNIVCSDRDTLGSLEALGADAPLPKLSSFRVLCSCVMLACRSELVCSSHCTGTERRSWPCAVARGPMSPLGRLSPRALPLAPPCIPMTRF